MTPAITDQSSASSGVIFKGTFHIYVTTPISTTTVPINSLNSIPSRHELSIRLRGASGAPMHAVQVRLLG
jgi:hypothetical protein